MKHQAKGRSMNGNETMIAVPLATADRIDSYIKQQRELGVAVQITIDTCGEMLAIPSDWRYEPAKRAFIAPDKQIPARVGPTGKSETAQEEVEVTG